MNPYIGDRQLEPDEDRECDTCDGFRIVLDRKLAVCPDEWKEIPCPDCNHDSDPGELNDPPEAD